MSQIEINELLAKLNENSEFNSNNDFDQNKHSQIDEPSTSLKFRSFSAFEGESNRSASVAIVNSRKTPLNRSFNTHLKLGQYAGRNGTNANIFSRSKTAVMFNYKSKRATTSVYAPLSKNQLNQNLTTKNVPIEFDGENPKRSIFTLVLMGIAYFGIELLFSIEIALTVPILLQLKVPETIYSLVYFVSPLIGFIFQPLLGSLSDRCTLKFGRRRPFILILAILAFIGFSLLINAYYLGQLLGDKNYDIPKIAIVLVGLGVTLLDFSADSSDSPLRALLLDSCNEDDLETGLNIHAILGGLGGATGYVLAAINWNKTFLKYIGDQFQILFMFSGVIFFVTLTLTLLSVKEVPFILNEEERPLNLKEKGLSNKLIDGIIEEDESLKIEQKYSEEEIKIDEDDSDQDDDDSEDKPVSLKMLYASLTKMPRELVRLMLCQLLGWMAYFTTALFFTDFIGESIYGGDPQAEKNSTSFELYNDGVKMGCWCLLAINLVSAISAFVLENYLISKFSTRTIYFFSYLSYGLCCTAIYFIKNIYAIIGISSIMGIFLTVLITLPYTMLSEFHKDKNYRSKSAAGTKRGLGIDCSLLSSIYFLAQSLISAIMSPIISQFSNYSILVLGAIFSLAGCLWISLFVIFPSIKENNINDKEKNNNC